MEWTAAAETTFQRVLATMPPETRSELEAAAQSELHSAAARRGRDVIEEDDVVRACIVTTPAHLRPGLRRAMGAAGVDVARWAAYFTV